MTLRETPALRAGSRQGSEQRHDDGDRRRPRCRSARPAPPLSLTGPRARQSTQEPAGQRRTAGGTDMWATTPTSRLANHENETRTVTASPHRALARGAVVRETWPVVETTNGLLGVDDVARLLRSERVWSLAASGELRSAAGHWPPRLASIRRAIVGRVPAGVDAHGDDAVVPDDDVPHEVALRIHGERSPPPRRPCAPSPSRPGPEGLQVSCLRNPASLLDHGGRPNLARHDDGAASFAVSAR